MNEIRFEVGGVELVADYDQLTSYKTNKQFARSESDPAGMFEAYERVFAGRDEEYVEALGGSIEAVGRMMQAAFEAAKAKKSQASSETSKGTATK